MRTILKYSAVATVMIALASIIFIILQKKNASPNLIGSEDVLHIWVTDEEDLDRKVRITSDGSISFPLVGDIQATGRTTSEVKDEIHSKILRYVPKAEVSVSVFKSPG